MALCLIRPSQTSLPPSLPPALLPSHLFPFPVGMGGRSFITDWRSFQKSVDRSYIDLGVKQMSAGPLIPWDTAQTDSSTPYHFSCHPLEHGVQLNLVEDEFRPLVGEASGKVGASSLEGREEMGKRDMG